VAPNVYAPLRSAMEFCAYDEDDADEVLKHCTWGDGDVTKLNINHTTSLEVYLHF